MDGLLLSAFRQNISIIHSSAQMKTISTFFLWEQVQPELWMNEHLLS